jgi:hypothetical protein
MASQMLEQTEVMVSSDRMQHEGIIARSETVRHEHNVYRC